jgi:hypothetical protein
MKTVFMSLILLLNFACNSISIEETKLQSLPQNIISPIPTSTVQKLEVNDLRVQYQVLRNVVYDQKSADSEITFGVIGSNYLSVRRETIVPQNFDELKNLPDLTDDLTDDLINDFIEKNKSKEKILATGDIDFVIDIVDQKGSIESVFKSKESVLKLQKKALWKLKGIVVLSRAGFNADHSKSLVYVEFYNPLTGLQKKYCLITWKPDGQSVKDKDVVWLQSK